MAEEVRSAGAVDQHRGAPEFDLMRPAGVTNHISRIRIPNMRCKATTTSRS